MMMNADAISHFGGKPTGVKLDDLLHASHYYFIWATLVSRRVNQERLQRAIDDKVRICRLKATYNTLQKSVFS